MPPVCTRGRGYYVMLCMLCTPATKCMVFRQRMGVTPCHASRVTQSIKWVGFYGVYGIWYLITYEDYLRILRRVFARLPDDLLHVCVLGGTYVD